MADPVWTGIDDVSVPPGSHICAFYRGSTARDRLLTAYFGTGLTAGDKCICIVESPDTASRLELLDRRPAGPGPCDHQLDVHLPESTYLAGFYHKPVERDNILMPFLADGLAAGDKCTCVVDSCTPGDVLDRLGERLEVAPYLSGRQLEVLDADGTYLAEGGFLPERMLKFWEAKARQGPSGTPAGSPATSAT